MCLVAIGTHRAPGAPAVVAAIALLAGPICSGASAQTPPVLRLEAGSVNPDDPFRTTLGYGAALGFGMGARHMLLLRVLRQSANRNSGPDLTSDARSFWLIGYELQGRPAERLKQQVIGRLVAGRLQRAPFRSTWVVGAAFAQRIQLFRSLAVVGSIEDLVAFLPHESHTTCFTPTDCSTTEIRGRNQHNFSLLVSFELRP